MTTWERKCEMLECANAGDDQGFDRIALEEASGFDAQALDMFLSGVLITEEHVAQWHESIKAVIDRYEAATGDLGIGSALRLEMLKQWTEELSLKETR